MDRPNFSMAAIVDRGLAMDNRQDAVAYLAQQHVPDRVIARVLSERAALVERRSKNETAQCRDGLRSD